MKRIYLSFFIPALASGLAAACTSGGGDSMFSERRAYEECLASEGAKIQNAQKETPKLEARLVATDPASFTNTLRESVKASAHERLEVSRIEALTRKRCEPLRPKPKNDDQWGVGVPMDAGAASMGSSSSSSGGMGSGAPTSASQASGTNNQVAGVDEADFIKNDNKYIYVANESRFRIIDAFPGSNMREIGSVAIEGTAKKIFVEGKRAVVYSSIPSALPASGYSGGWWRAPGGECTYGQSGCVPSGDGTETEIAIFDLSDLTKPKPVRRIRSTSSLISARRIGTRVHTVLSQPSPFNVSLPYVSVDADWDERKIDAEYRKARANFDAIVDEKPVEGGMLPSWEDSAGRGKDLRVYTSPTPDGDAFTSVLSLDLASDGDLSIASVIGRPGWVYASTDSLYMAVPQQRHANYGWYETDESEVTTVHQFSLTDGTAGYVASGLVGGRVLNQFAMDEHAGHLRIATTTGHLPDPDAHNTLTVLERQGVRLTSVGKIDDIAPTEDIRSVRFDGDRGYVVTFKKTDPLYVFDLVDPRAPKILGELKIPGFSTYMHMMDESHLLTIGYDAADKGDFAFFTGILLQIFDVSNPRDPKLTHKEVIGTRGSSSEAATNHLAFNYFAPKNLLAIPMTICEGGSENGGYGTEMTFSGLMVYEVTTQGGFELRGKVGHPSVTNQQNSYGYYNAACSNWWTNASSEVKRSIIMDDWVYSVSDSRIKANTLTNLGQDVKEVAIGSQLLQQQK